MNRLRATSRDRPGQRAPRLERRRDVEDDDLVDALDVVARRQLGRIAGRPQPFELHALDDLSVADVETRDDPLRRVVRNSCHVFRRGKQTIGSCIGSNTGSQSGALWARRQKLRSMARPASPDFLRVELQAEDRAALDDAGERVRPRRRRRRRRLADRRRERVREVGLRPRRDAGQDRRRPRRVHGVPADVRHLELGPALGREHHVAGPTRAPACRSGRAAAPAPADPAPRCCLRTGTAAPGRCRGAACRCGRGPGSPRAMARRAPPSPRSGRRPARSGRRRPRSRRQPAA